MNFSICMLAVCVYSRPKSNPQLNLQSLADSNYDDPSADFLPCQGADMEGMALCSNCSSRQSASVPIDKAGD